MARLEQEQQQQLMALATAAGDSSSAASALATLVALAGGSADAVAALQQQPSLDAASTMPLTSMPSLPLLSSSHSLPTHSLQSVQSVPIVPGQDIWSAAFDASSGAGGGLQKSLSGNGASGAPASHNGEPSSSATAPGAIDWKPWALGGGLFDAAPGGAAHNARSMRSTGSTSSISSSCLNAEGEQSMARQLLSPLLLLSPCRPAMAHRQLHHQNLCPPALCRHPAVVPAW
jgi:hypothetical protein